MKWFANLRMRDKLLGAFLIVLAMTGAVGLFTLSRMGRVYAVGDDINTRLVPQLQEMSELRATVVEAEVHVKDAIIKEDAAESAEEWREFAKLDEEIRDRGRKYLERAQEGEDKKAVQEAMSHWSEYVKSIAEVRRLHEEDDLAGMHVVLYGVVDENHEGTARAIDTAYEANQRTAGARMKDADATYAGSRSLTSTALALALVVGLALALWLAGMVATPVAGLMKVVDAAEKGDLTVRAPVLGKDELGRMTAAMNQFLEHLHDSMAKVAISAEQLAQVSEELHAGAETLSAGAQEQASSIEETAASLEQINTTAKQSADRASEAANVAEGSRDGADAGGAVVGRAVTAMGEISSASKRIAEIIGVIDEIAFQTNLLALNAAVEAARAGEQGRGFAVVAAEVRNLAQRSASAAKEIKALINDSLAKVGDGTKLVNTSGRTFEDIVSSVRRVTDLVGQIASAGREQASGIEQVSRAVSQMDQVVQANSAQTEELSATAGELEKHAIALRDLVERFTLIERARTHEAGKLSSKPDEKSPMPRDLAFAH